MMATNVQFSNFTIPSKFYLLVLSCEKELPPHLHMCMYVCIYVGISEWVYGLSHSRDYNILVSLFLGSKKF